MYVRGSYSKARTWIIYDKCKGCTHLKFQSVNFTYYGDKAVKVKMTHLFYTELKMFVTLICFVTTN